MIFGAFYFESKRIIEHLLIAVHGGWSKLEYEPYLLFGASL